MRKIILAIILVGMILLSGCEMMAGKAGTQCSNPPPSIIGGSERMDAAKMTTICADRCKNDCPASQNCECASSQVKKGNPTKCPDQLVPTKGTTIVEQLDSCKQQAPNVCKNIANPSGCQYGWYTITREGQCRIQCYKPEYYCYNTCKSKQTPKIEAPRTVAPQTTAARPTSVQYPMPSQYVGVNVPTTPVYSGYQVPSGTPETINAPSQQIAGQPYPGYVPGQIPGEPYQYTTQQRPSAPQQIVYPPGYPAGYPQEMPVIYPGQ